MTYRTLYLLTILLPTAIIGGFEYIRHRWLLQLLSMEAGNLVITLLTLVLSFFYASWMFRTLHRINEQLAEERARRAVYEERERLARELHDGIAQSLFYLNVKLKQGRVEEARSAVAAMDSQVRQAIFNLRSLPDDGNAFSDRLAKWLGQWSVLAGVEVTHTLSIPARFFSPAEEVQLFGVIQEAFANIRKHAGARHVRLALTASPHEGWELFIADDGCGIGSADPAAPRYGLAMMRERAAELGAEMSITAPDAGGTEIRLRRASGGGRR